MIYLELENMGGNSFVYIDLGRILCEILFVVRLDLSLNMIILYECIEIYQKLDEKQWLIIGIFRLMYFSVLLYMIVIDRSILISIILGVFIMKFYLFREKVDLIYQC